MSDLTWKELDLVQIGDKILTVEENPKPNEFSTRPTSRQWKIATVTNKVYSCKPSTKISTDNGYLIGSDEHKLLTAGRDKKWKLHFGWKNIKDIKTLIKNYPNKNLYLRFFEKPWENDKSYDAGWLSGIYDGEGNLCATSRKVRGSVASCEFSQNEGLVLERGKEILDKLGFKYSIIKKTSNLSDGCKALKLLGGFKETIKLLGILQPIRLIDKIPEFINKLHIGTQKTTIPSKITSIEEVGNRMLVDITTTEGTFIANGFIVHNCLGFGGSEKRTGGAGEFEEVSRVQRGLLALDNLTQAYLGFFLKSLSKVNRAKLIKESLTKVLEYNVLDPKYTAKVYDFLIKDLEANNLMKVYKEQCRRVPTAVLTQRQGLAYSAEQAEAFYKEYTEKLTLKTKESLLHPSIIEYRTKFGGFNITTPADVAGLFKYLGFKTEDKDGNSKSGKDILTLIDHPIARNIESIRETGKVLSTYIEPFISKAIVFPDNRLHTQFTTMFTTTGRLSSLDPNIQNFPKRANKQIRKTIIAPPGFKLVSNDYGQIEARVLAMASKDPEFCKALWTGFDIHSYWALLLAQSYPKRVGGDKIVQKWSDANIETLKDTDKLFKGFRDIVKNKWVFPAFFGASTKSLAGYMGIPYVNAETVQKKFWKTYAVIKAWQDTMYSFYAAHGYVESLTGHRRYMYMQGGEIINHPIQGTAAAIVMDGMNRLSEYSTETGQEQFQAVMQIHDDLGFYLPEETWEADHKFIVKEMLSCKFDFINVPLTVESAVGPNWYELKEIGTYSSDKLQ